MPKDILQQAEEALKKLDSDRLISLYSDDFIFEDISSGDSITSEEDLKDYFDKLFSLPNIRFTNVCFFGFGDRAAGQWTWVGTSPRSGQKFSIRGASLFKIENI